MEGNHEIDLPIGEGGRREVEFLGIHGRREKEWRLRKWRKGNLNRDGKRGEAEWETEED